jgi:RNA polymerase sigma-70 factor (ECF subfamily)
MRKVDGQIIKKAAQGERKAQGIIYRQYQPRVLNFILQHIDDLSDGEEILQETFISVFEALPFFEQKSSLFTWICGIAKHEIGDFYRKKKIKEVVFSLFPQLEQIASQALGPEAKLEKEELKKRVEKVLGLLTEGYSLVLRLKYIKGFSVREIAARLKKSEKAIESRLTRARKAFARVYVVIEEKNQPGI